MLCSRGSPPHGLCGHLRFRRALLAERVVRPLCGQRANDYGPRGFRSCRQGRIWPFIKTDGLLVTLLGARFHRLLRVLCSLPRQLLRSEMNLTIFHKSTIHNIIHPINYLVTSHMTKNIKDYLHLGEIIITLSNLVYVQKLSNGTGMFSRLFNKFWITWLTHFWWVFNLRLIFSRQCRPF